MKKATNRQYSTDDHDVHTMTKAEYDAAEKSHVRARTLKMQKSGNKSQKVYLHQSRFAGTGDKVW